MPQPGEGVTYAEKIDKSETRIDWSKPAQDVHNHIRGLSPFPGAWFEMEGRRRAGADQGAAHARMAAGRAASRAPCSTTNSPSPAADGAIRILELQRAGKQPMKASQFLRGNPVKAGARVA